MDVLTRATARREIATACLAAMVSQRDVWAPERDGDLVEVACDYADRLLRELEKCQRLDQKNKAPKPTPVNPHFVTSTGDKKPLAGMLQKRAKFG